MKMGDPRSALGRGVKTGDGFCLQEHLQGICSGFFTFSIRIRSPHSASRILSIMMRSSLVIFHCLLAKWTTAKSRPYCPAEISPFTFRTTSAGKQRGRGQGSTPRELGRAGKTPPATLLSPQHSYLLGIFKQGSTAALLPRCASLPLLKLMIYLYFRCWQSHT